VEGERLAGKDNTIRYITISSLPLINNINNRHVEMHYKIINIKMIWNQQWSEGWGEGAGEGGKIH
jgi:hypothetical protein